MRTVERSVRLSVDAARAWEACLQLLRSPDPARGIVERRCEPDPPRPGGRLVTTVRAPGGGTRELVSRIVELDAPASVTTASEDEGPSVRTTLAVAAEAGGSRVTLRSEATTGLSGRRLAGRLLDAAILGRSQRRSARATLARIRALASTSGHR